MRRTAAVTDKTTAKTMQVETVGMLYVYARIYIYVHVYTCMHSVHTSKYTHMHYEEECCCNGRYDLQEYTSRNGWCAYMYIYTYACTYIHEL